MTEEYKVYLNINTGHRFIMKPRDLEYLLKEENLEEGTVKELPEASITAEENVYRVEAYLEDINFHSLQALPSRLLKKLQEERRFTEPQLTEILKAFGEAIVETVE